MSMGIKETRELIKFITDLGEGFGHATEDSDWSISDIYHFLPAAKSAFAGIAGIDEVVQELFDLDEEEREELKQYVIEEFDILNDNAEEYVERALSLALDLWYFIKDFFGGDDEEDVVE